MADDRVAPTNWALPRQEVQGDHPGSMLSFVSGSAIKRITAGVKARRGPFSAKFSIRWPGLHPPAKSVSNEKKNTALRYCLPPSHSNIGRLSPTIRQERSLGKVNWTASVISDPERPIKARAIPSAPGGPFNLFKPGAVKVVPEPPKQCRAGCHFNRACLNPRKQAHAVLRWELVIRRYLRIRNMVEPVGCILAAPGTPSTSSRLSGKIMRGPTHRYTKWRHKAVWP